MLTSLSFSCSYGLMCLLPLNLTAFQRCQTCLKRVKCPLQMTGNGRLPGRSTCRRLIRSPGGRRRRRWRCWKSRRRRWGGSPASSRPLRTTIPMTCEHDWTAWTGPGGGGECDVFLPGDCVFLSATCSTWQVDQSPVRGDADRSYSCWWSISWGSALWFHHMFDSWTRFMTPKSSGDAIVNVKGRSIDVQSMEAMLPTEIWRHISAACGDSSLLFCQMFFQIKSFNIKHPLRFAFISLEVS